MAVAKLKIKKEHVTRSHSQSAENDKLLSQMVRVYCFASGFDGLRLESKIDLEHHRSCLIISVRMEFVLNNPPKKTRLVDIMIIANCNRVCECINVAYM